MTDQTFDFDEVVGGTFAMDVPLEERLSSADAADSPNDN